MKNNNMETTIKLKNINLSQFSSDNEQNLTLEIVIAALIHSGSSIYELLEPIDSFNNKEDEEKMKTKINNIVIDFIALNPKYGDILRKNNANYEFLKTLD